LKGVTAVGRSAAAVLLWTALISPVRATEPPPLLPEPAVRAIASEVSGTAAKRNLQDLTLFHRMRGSRGFRAAAERVRDRAREYGLAEVEILELPADGKVFYGTQRSRPAWDTDFAELWEQRQEGGAWVDAERIASWEARPIVLAQDSAGGEAEAELVDVGAGNAEADYKDKDVRGKLVLTSAQPGAVYALAVDRFGAAGIVSYAQNQVTGWWKEDETLVRWGHLNTFPAPKTFACMVSLRQARAWQARGRPAGAAAGERQGRPAPRGLQHRDGRDPGHGPGSRDRPLLPPRPPAARSERQRQRLLLDPGGGPHARQAGPRGEARRSPADDPLRLAAGD
jgi:hypothetical protein